jgi:hypothetical protein
MKESVKDVRKEKYKGRKEGADILRQKKKLVVPVEHQRVVTLA